MAEIKQLQLNNVDILPVTHESAVVDNNGTTITAKYQPKNDTGLTTSSKSVVGAINEINNNLLGIGDLKTTVGSLQVRYVKYNGETFYPITHTDAVIDSSGAVLSTTLNTLTSSINTSASKVSTIESNINTLKTTTTNLSTTANTLTTNVGTLSSLNTSTKTSIVAAINEVFQLGNNAKNRLVAALIAKGSESITTSSSLEDVLTILEKKAIMDGREGWTVEAVSGASYGFKSVVSGSTTYWESNNKGIHGTAAVCKLTVTNPHGKNVTLNYVNSGESGYDYCVISQINTTLNLTNTNDAASNVKLSNPGSSTSWKQLALDAASGWYYIKYRKDGSDNAGNDSLRFYVTIG